MNFFDKVYGTPRFPEISIRDLNALHESAIRSAIQYYTIQGYISENKIIRHLSRFAGISNVTRVPDYSAGHGGDITFVFNNKLYKMEIKTLSLTNGRGRVNLAPTRKSDVHQAYRVTDFDFFGVFISGRSRNACLFASTKTFPRHKKNNAFLRASIVLNEATRFNPFTNNLLELLK